MQVAKKLREIPSIPVYSGDVESQQSLLNYLLKAGKQAPSWYNSQPWELKAGENYIDVFLDPTADTSLYDWDNANSTMACGAVLHNIYIAAVARGLSPQILKQPNASQPLWMGRVVLDFNQVTESLNQHDLLLERSIWLRHTNTLLYKNDELEKSQQQTLANTLNNHPDTSLHFITSDIDKQRLFEAISLTEEIRFSRQDLHDYLHSMIRWTEKDEQLYKTGYTLPSMGICGVGKFVFQATKSWPIMRFLNRFGSAANLAKRASEGVTHCSAVGLITMSASGDTDNDYLEAGQAMESVWLAANKLGLDLHPFNTLLMFSFALKQDPSLFSKSEGEKIEQTMQLVQGVYDSVNWERDEVAVFLFRIGKGEAVSGYSLRK